MTPVRGHLRRRLAGAAAILRRPATFGLVGAANTLVDLGAFLALTGWLGMAPLPANVASYTLGAGHSFVMNGLVTFADRERRWLSLRHAARFAGVTLVGLAVSSAVLAAALPFMPALAAKLVATAVTFAVGYRLSSRLVYR